MAVCESIREGLDALNAALYEAQSFSQVIDGLVGHQRDDMGAMSHCIRSHIERLTASSEALERLLNMQVMPMLRGLE